MKPSSISVVIPNYNHGQYILKQLDALASQSVPPLEVIVVDDASTDDSVRIVEDYARNQPLVRLIRHERNRGVNAALTTGLAACRGEFYYGGAADDAVAPGFIERTERMIERFPQAGIYVGMYRAVDPEDREIRIERVLRWDEERYAPPEVFLSEYLEVQECSHSLSPATVYRKRCVEEAGGYRAELGSWADTFMLRAIALKYGAGYTPHVQATMRRMPEGFSGSQARDVRLMLDIVARAAWLMRLPEFRDRFPEPHVARWEKAYRDYVFWGDLWASHESLLAATQPGHNGEKPAWRRLIGWPRRLQARLVISRALRQFRAYVPDLSCYEAPGK
jgi:glycosyltransferase involved in cell wall biosynthesis